jgi:methionyl-tRNA formyltransferase
VAFLGTPAVAARSLELLLDASTARDPTSSYEIVTVVSQPPAPVGRKKVLTRSPVHALAAERGVSVLTPPSAKDEGFLDALAALELDLCITAAYGCFLPRAFLALPKRGTLNLHPSLLPKYRGAAPVQRALEAGEETTGVTVLFTVLKMDAGPIVRQAPVQLAGDEQSGELLLSLFELGTRELIRALPSVWSGQASEYARAQEEAHATHAPKLSKEDALASFEAMGAATIHNRVRAFAEWPGTLVSLYVGGQPTEVKLCRTRLPSSDAISPPQTRALWLDGDALAVECAGGSTLHILELQVAGRKRVDARAFWNGLQGKDKLTWLR